MKSEQHLSPRRVLVFCSLALAVDTSSLVQWPPGHRPPDSGSALLKKVEWSVSTKALAFLGSQEWAVSTKVGSRQRLVSNTSTGSKLKGNVMDTPSIVQNAGLFLGRGHQQSIEDDVDLMLAAPNMSRPRLVLLDAIDVFVDALVWGVPNMAWGVMKIAGLLMFGSDVTQQVGGRASKVRRAPVGGPALIQRRAARRNLRRPLPENEPRDVEDHEKEYLWGIPKGVWVVIADVSAIALWFGGIFASMGLSREPVERTSEEIFAEKHGMMPSEKAIQAAVDAHYMRSYSPTPTFSGNLTLPSTASLTYSRGIDGPAIATARRF